MPYLAEVIDVFLAATAQSVPSRDGYLARPPLALPIVAEDIAQQDRADVTGRHVNPTGEIFGIAGLEKTNTSFTGSILGPGGTVFDLSGVGTGQFKVFRDAQLYDAWGILMPANDVSGERVLTESVTRPDIEPQSIIIRRWMPVGTDLTSATWYTHVELAFGGNINFRIRAAYNEPISLQITTDAGTTWRTVKEAKALGNAEQYIKKSHDMLCIHLFPDRTRKFLLVEIGDGNYLSWSVQNRDDASTIPPGFFTIGRTRVSFASGAFSLHVFPIQWTNPRVAIRYVDEAKAYLDSPEAYLGVNALSPDKDVGVTKSVVNVGDTFQVNMEQDATSLPTPRLTDGTLIIPSWWTYSVPGGTEIPIGPERLAAMQVIETKEWNDNLRVFSTSGQLVCNNKDGFYVGAYRRRALNLYASVDNGASVVQRMAGVVGIGPGMTIGVYEGIRRLKLPFADNAVKMMVPLGHELILDSWHLGSAVRYLMERGNVDWTVFSTPTSIPPLYIPPGMPPYAPYGPANFDVPDGEIVLGTGFGNSPRYRFSPEMTCWQVLQMLCQDTSDVFGNPYYMGFDDFGIFHFEPFVPGNLPIVACFAGNPQTSVLNTLLPSLPMIKIDHACEVQNSTENMRSELTFQGVDAASFELLTGHFNQFPVTKEDLGWREPWYERQGRWSSQPYIEFLLVGSAIQAALPVQTINISSMFYPGLTAGMKIAVDDIQTIGALPRTYIITRQTASYGMSDILGDSPVQLGSQILTARWTGNYPP